MKSQGKRVVHVKNDSLGQLHIYYDGNRPDMVLYNGATYRYVHSLQGDILGLQNGTGSFVVEYRYDAWGRQVGKTGSLAATLGTLNPFRYRGYVYDEEIGLYYLRSRYYNPDWCRFISADSILGQVGGLLQHNLFAYCHNDPVNGRDESGFRATSAFKLFLSDCVYAVKNTVEYIGSSYVYLYQSMNQPLKEDEDDELDIFYFAYSEHHKKGTTNKANKGKHERGQARKRRDSGGEKGDARRKPNPNKRRHQSIVADNGYTIWDKVLAGGNLFIGGAIVIYLFANDITGIGVVDNAAILPTIYNMQYSYGVLVG